MLRLVISYHLLLLGVITPFCSRALQCAIKILRLNFYGNFVCCFFYVCIIGMNWPLGITFFVFYKFGYVVYSFLFDYRKSLFFFLYFCCDLIFSSSDELFGFYEFLFFLIFLMLIYSFICGDQIRCSVSFLVSYIGLYLLIQSMLEGNNFLVLGHPAS